VLSLFSRWKTVQADLLIGADGINSVVRQNNRRWVSNYAGANVLAGARSIFSRAIVSQRNNCVIMVKIPC